MSRPASRMSRCCMLAAVLVALVASAAQADFAGRVVSVADGDTLTVLAGRLEKRVRLVGIDAPEHAQPYGTAARRSLAALVAGRDVRVREHGSDGYGRVLGVVFVGGLDVNAEQVRRGFAWVFRRYTHDPRLLALEDEARAAKRGLWREASPIPPWEWRDRHEAAPHAARYGALPTVAEAGFATTGPA